MRVCLLGEYNENLDEGMRKTSFYIARELSKYHQILPLDLRKVTSKSFWREFKDFNPQIVHYIHGASLKSFTLLKIFFPSNSFSMQVAKKMLCLINLFCMSSHKSGFVFLSKRGEGNPDLWYT